MHTNLHMSDKACCFWADWCTETVC